MKRFRVFAFSLLAAIPFSIGCSQHSYYVSPPPPPPPAPLQTVPPLVEMAEHNGFQTGMDDGARDAYNGWGYYPERNRNYHYTPGYDPRFGPFGPYQSYFRSAYLRGYERGFNRR